MNSMAMVKSFQRNHLRNEIWKKKKHDRGKFEFANDIYIKLKVKNISTLPEILKLCIPA